VIDAKDNTGIEEWKRAGRKAKLQRAIYATTTKQHETEEPDYCLLSVQPGPWVRIPPPADPALSCKKLKPGMDVPLG
jgi:hypothetical protein